jgi:hypothetical protein
MEILEREVQLFGKSVTMLTHRSIALFRPEQSSVSSQHINKCTTDICFNFYDGWHSDNTIRALPLFSKMKRFGRLKHQWKKSVYNRTKLKPRYHY